MLPKSLDTLRIDINSGKVRKSVAICQNDNVQRTLNFQIVNSGTAIDMDNLLFAEILIHKPDGYEADNGCVIDGDSIQYTLRTTDIAALGVNEAQLQLTFEDGQVLTTPTFEIVVYSKVLDQRVQRSTNEYNALTQQLVQVNEYKNQALAYKNEAATSATNATASANAANAAMEVVGEYAGDARDYATAAGTSASDAAASATTATTKASEASTSAGNAATSASNAAGYAAEIENQISIAQAAATEAVDAASSASDDATTATTQASNAQSSASAAATSATSAAKSATDAKGYLDIVDASAVSAAQSATLASNKADAAGLSEINAASSATDAEESATAAANSASGAAQSATTATNKASEASTSAGTATTKASEASTSAGNAATKASQASDYSDTAQAYAQAAAQSAQEAKDAAETASAGGLELGETANKAYRGDRGKTAYDHSQTSGNPHATTYLDVGADAAGAAADAYQQAAGYIDLRISQLINGAPQTLDTLKEIADAMAASETVVQALQDAIGDKADEADFTGHANNSTIHITANERTNWNAAYGKVAEVNAMHRQIYGHCTTAAATQTKVITLDDNATLKNGDILYVTFQYTNSFNATANNHVTFSIGGTTYAVAYDYDPSNGTYRYPTGTSWTNYGSAKMTMYYKVDVTNHVLLHLGHSTDANTGWSPQALGIGYGTCTTAEATAAKVATMNGYALFTNGLVAIKFTNAVPASATLNINSRGAKAIYYKGAAITTGIIKAGDTALFVYNGSQYMLLSIDKAIDRVISLESSLTALTNKVASLEGKIGYPISPS